MKNSWFIVFMVLQVQFCGVNAQTNSRTKLAFGVNGHPLNQKAYLDATINEQLMLVKSVNSKYYRIDVPTHADGTIQNEARFVELAQQARMQKIHIVPMLYLTGFKFSLSKDDAYAMGSKLGLGFGEKYGKYVDYYELGNEMDVQKGLGINSGSDYADYLSPQIDVLASFMEGLNQGLKRMDPGAKTIVNCAGWFHFVYLELLKKHGVHFDIAGYHWYSNMDDYSKKVNVDILKVLPKRLQMPVWFTELNYVDKETSGAEYEKKRKDWVMNFVKECSSADGIDALFFYELLDQPDLKTTSLTERTFGLFSKDKRIRNAALNGANKTGQSKWMAKPLGKALQASKFKR